MRLGCFLYDVEAEVQGKPVPADLTHLEKALNEAGFATSKPLKKIQDREEDGVRIFPSIFTASHVRREGGKVELVVYYEDNKLQEFARGYEPVPLRSAS